MLRIFARTLVLLLFAPAVFAESVTLSWDRPTDDRVTGFEIRYGITPGAMTFMHDAGNVGTATISWTAQAGATYYFRARSYDEGKTQFSAFSNEVSYATVLILKAPINLRIVK